VRHLSDLPDDEAREALRACCASTKWVERMLSQRPFKSADEILASAERLWLDLQPSDWLEAFAAHPRIGGQTGRRADGPTGHGPRGDAWSKSEQASVDSASDDVKARLTQANHDYESMFGWTYIVCATGKSAEEMLALARARMNNPPDTELQLAAAEQAKITRLRLQKMLEAHS
jgi:2-oxo-4-hydroxy-4-carboxy-5-ureidoimidazoline decarboxylase